MFGRNSFSTTAVRVLVAAGAISLVLSAAPAGALEGCHGSATAHETFKVDLQAADTDLRLGDTARVSVKVTRDTENLVEAGRDDVNTQAPVAGAEVFVGLVTGDTVVYGAGTTNENGRASITIKINRYMNLGFAKAEGFAWTDHAEGPCHTIVREYGEAERARFAKISG